MSVLDTCHVNDVVGVIYGDDAEERICRVIDVRNLIINPLSPKTIARRPHIARGDNLVTCQDTSGKIRSFYSGTEHNARFINKLLAGILYLRGKLPARKKVMV